MKCHTSRVIAGVVQIHRGTNREGEQVDIHRQPMKAERISAQGMKHSTPQIFSIETFERPKNGFHTRDHGTSVQQ